MTLICFSLSLFFIKSQSSKPYIPERATSTRATWGGIFISKNCSASMPSLARTTSKPRPERKSLIAEQKCGLALATSTLSLAPTPKSLVWGLVCPSADELDFIRNGLLQLLHIILSPVLVIPVGLNVLGALHPGHSIFTDSPN